MAEADRMRLLQRFASKLGARLFRQNTGMGWVGKQAKTWPGKIVTIRHGDVLLHGARPFHAGVKGMSDLGGWVPVTVTPEMVGQTIAIYVQAEIKEDGGRPTAEQENWINAVNNAGGRAGVARTEADLQAIIFQEK
jgi:hypothetical protein